MNSTIVVHKELSPADRTRLDQPSITDLVAAVRADQSQRWRTGTPLPVESYFNAFPRLAKSAEDVLVLISGEIGLRLERGESDVADDFVRRFPHVADDIPLLCAAQQVLREHGPPAKSAERPNVPGYEIEEEIGRGAMGVVYRARQINLGRTVALKVLLSGTLAGSSAVARFHSEAQALARLKHRNIVQVIDVTEAQTPGGARVPCIALEYVDGPTLAVWAGGQPVDVMVAAQLVEQMADGIQAAHEAGIVHRDLKPANILMSVVRRPSSVGQNSQTTDTIRDALPIGNGQRATDNGQIKIADFGLAKLLDGSGEQTASGAILGTPAYMAPEQVTQRSDQLGPPSDIYALGAVLYELLTGLPPFRGANPLEIIQQLDKTEPVPPTKLRASVPRDLENICLKCLEKDPQRRYDSAAALSQDLQRFQAGAPVLARPVSGVERTWRWCRRYPVVSGLATAVVLLTLVVAVVSSWSAITLRRSLTATQLAERKIEVQLIDSIIAQADATRKSLQSGQRFETIRLLQEAAKRCDELGITDRNDRIRDLGLSAIALPDIAPTRRLKGVYPAGSAALAINPTQSIYAVCNAVGKIAVRRINDNSEVINFDVGLEQQLGGTFNHDGRYLAYGNSKDLLRIWDMDSGSAQPIIECPNHTSLRFREDNRSCVIAADDGSIAVYDLPSGQPIVRWPAASLSRKVDLAVHPSRPLVSTSSYFHKRLVIRDLTDGSIVADLPLPASTGFPAFSRDGQLLAVPCTNSRMYVFDTNTWTIRWDTACPDHGTQIAFIGDSHDIIGVGWSHEYYVWRSFGVGPAMRTAWMESSNGIIEWNHRMESSNGVGPAMRTAEKVGYQVHLVEAREPFAATINGEDVLLWSFAPGNEVKVLKCSDRFKVTGTNSEIAIHPAGRLLAVPYVAEIQFWDIGENRALPDVLGIGGVHRVEFDDDGSLHVGGTQGTWKYPWRSIGSAAEMRYGMPECISEMKTTHITSSRDGQLVAWSCQHINTMQPFQGGWIRRKGGPLRALRMHPGWPVGPLSVTADGSRIAVMGEGGDNTGRQRLTQDGRVTTRADIKRDRTHQPNVADASRYSSFGPRRGFFQVSPERPDEIVPIKLRSKVGVCAFTSDNSLVAEVIDSKTIELYEFPADRTVARLYTQDQIGRIGFSPDGRQLFGMFNQSSAFVWDLPSTGAELRRLGLDRGTVPFPQFPEQPSKVDTAPLKITFPHKWFMTREGAATVEMVKALALPRDEMLRHFGRAFQRLRLYNVSAVAFGKLAERLPQDPEAAYELGLAAIEAKNWSATLQYFALAHKDPQLHDISRLLCALVLRREGREAEADAEVADLAAADPKLVNTYWGEGMTMFEEERYGPASLFFDEACRRSPTDAVSLRFGALLAATAPAPWRDPAKALELARRARTADPATSAARWAQALALLRLNRLSEARSAFAELEALGEQLFTLPARYALAVVHARLGDRATAQWHFDQAEAELPRPIEKAFAGSMQMLIRSFLAMRAEARAALAK